MDAKLIDINFSSKIGAVSPNLTISKSAFYSGESAPLSSLFNASTTAGIVFSSPDGYYDSNTDSLIFPKNLNSKTVQLIATNSDGGTQQIPIKINGVDESFVIETPQTYGDQNYPTSGTKLADGKMFIGTIVIDSAGAWEWSVINCSTDNGLNWSVVDNYQPYNHGEAHILAMASQGSNVYYCGYQWDYDNGSDNRWYIRRSANAGTTWQTADLDSSASTDSACQSITVSPTTGYVYAAGSDHFGAGGIARWVLKESQDQGQTWSIIYSQDVNNYSSKILHIRVAPDNSIWLIGANASNNAVLYKGTYAGSWIFNSMGVNFGTATASNYQTFGELSIVDSNTAFLNSRFGATWNIKRTTDGGVSWTQVYNAGASTQAGEFEVLNNGDMLAMGTYIPAGFGPRDAKLARSTDGGTTWSATTLKTEEYANGCLLFQDNANGVHAINAAQNYATHFFSSNSGASWTEKDFLVYTEKFYNEISKLLILPSGNFLTVGYAGNYSRTVQKSPWFAGISSDQGQTWTYPDLYVDPSNNLTSYDAAYDQLGNIYSYGVGYTDHSSRVRKSTDNGQTWSNVEVYIHPTYPNDPITWQSQGRFVVDKNNVPYYGAFYYNTGVSKGYVEIRKGTVGGGSWSTVKTFPLNAAYKAFYMVDLKVSSDNTLWLSGKETNASNQAERVLYKSTDGGVNWTEVRRESNTTDNSYEQISFDSSGAIYLRQVTQIQKSIDGGTTWTTIMNTGTPKDMLVTSNDKIFVLMNDNKLMKLQADSSWLLINDQTEQPNPTGRNYIYQDYVESIGLIELSPTTLGLQTRFTESKVGTVELIKTIPISN
ncbi:sialidase family protein [Bdellovibrio svalbardensis]|uniref:Glycoside hydrolase n=1 Tax=Bdellovibrio svalbardensis TaxID=2972972 RepID=A0ABT6DNT0_9BACT|nr:sialidase family protein [Bdellovibrio svalbardensis]MDG0818147.1 glycoside hydrolase [Bdellovibrio svalbardensis]